jgi:hypothetical protein
MHLTDPSVPRALTRAELADATFDPAITRVTARALRATLGANDLSKSHRRPEADLPQLLSDKLAALSAERWRQTIELVVQASRQISSGARELVPGVSIGRYLSALRSLLGAASAFVVDAIWRTVELRTLELASELRRRVTP